MARKPGLGKGLDALIPEVTIKESAADGITSVPINQIIPNPQQPRYKIKEENLKELASSIQEHGILQPLVVSRDEENDRYILIAGERRLRAATLINLEMVPVIIRQATEQQRLELALIENIQRADLTPLETAEAYHQLNEIFNLSHEEIAKRVGKSRVAITNNVRLLKLPQAVRGSLADGEITEGHARALLGLDSVNAQTAALKTILKQNLSVRQTEELVRKLAGQKPAKKPDKPEPSPEFQEIENRLRSHLGTKVILSHGKKGGSVTIHYYSDEELDAIIQQILKD